LAHIGGISRHKGYHLIRNAVLANAYSNLELLIVDHGMPPGTRRETKWGTTPVTFIGKVPQSTVAQLYRDIDVLLAPSIWPESYGLVTREAMACGNWVIASDRGAIGADVEEGVNGHRISVDSYTGLAEVLWRVDRNPGRYLGPPESRRQPRTVLAQVEALDQLYRDLLSEVVSKSTTRTNYQ
jgi:glycosyltransferase involved in cell wall biosynthesis